MSALRSADMSVSDERAFAAPAPAARGRSRPSALFGRDEKLLERRILGAQPLDRRAVDRDQPHRRLREHARRADAAFVAQRASPEELAGAELADALARVDLHGAFPDHEQPEP